MIESAIVATYLLREGDAAVEDFRRCSYKDTLRILRDYESESGFFRHACRSARSYGPRSTTSLSRGCPRKASTSKNAIVWRLQGKSLYDIFGEVTRPDEYPFVYGILSEPIHGSWNQSMDRCLSRNGDGTFSGLRSISWRRCPGSIALGAIHDAPIPSLARTNPASGRLNAPGVRSYP